MKRILITVLMAAATAVQADVLYQYDFNTDGSMTNSPNWRAYSGPDGSATNAGGVGWFGGGTEDLGPTNAYASQSGQVYLGIDLDVREGGSDGQYILGFMTGNGVMSGRMFITMTGASTYNLGLSGDSGTPTYYTTDLNLNTEYRIVLGYDNSVDEHTLWVNPLTSEEATPDLVITEAVASSPNGVFFRQSTTWGADLASWSVDNLVVASDFANAVVPEPGTLGFISMGMLALLARRKLRG